MDELSDSGGRGFSSKTEGSLPIREAPHLIAFSLLFLWVNREFWSLRLSIQLFQQASNRTDKQTNKQGRKERAEMKWIIVQENIRQSKLSGIYAAIKGKNTRGEMDFADLECGP